MPPHPILSRLVAALAEVPDTLFRIMLYRTTSSFTLATPELTIPSACAAE